MLDEKFRLNAFETWILYLNFMCPPTGFPLAVPKYNDESVE